MATVSVIVPVFRHPSFVQAAVNSLLAQTFTSFELLLVDDGSPDGCGALCDELAAKDARIHVFHQENRGAWAARNTGLAHAQGQYVFFADADDLCHPALLAVLVKEAQTNHCDFVRCRFARFSGRDVENAKETTEPSGYMPNPAAIWQQLALPLVGRYNGGPLLCGTACTTLLRRAIIEENGLRFCNETLGEDLQFILCFLAFCQTGSQLPEVLYYYRSTPGSVTCGGFSPEKAEWLLRQNAALLFFGQVQNAVNQEYRIRVAARLLDAASVQIKEALLGLPFAGAKTAIDELLQREEMQEALSLCHKQPLPLLQKICFFLAGHPGLRLLGFLVKRYNPK